MNKIISGLIFATLGVATLSAQTYSGDSSYGGGGSYSGGGYDSGGYDRRELQLVGLTSDQRLIIFDEFSPDRSSTAGTVSGLTGGDTALIGIDYRVQNGMLYGVGNAGGVYIFR